MEQIKDSRHIPGWILIEDAGLIAHLHLLYVVFHWIVYVIPHKSGPLQMTANLLRIPGAYHKLSSILCIIL